jgi:hypothetical protein
MFLALVLILGVFSTPAKAAEQRFEITNNHPHIVYFKVFSNRKGKTWEWPSTTSSFVLNRTYHNFSITCRQGERICWGAADKDHVNYWGRGIKTQSLGCATCCYTCTHGTVIREALNFVSNNEPFVPADEDGEGQGCHPAIPESCAD